MTQAGSHDNEVFHALLDIVRTPIGSDRLSALGAIKALQEEIRAAGVPVFATLLGDDSPHYGHVTASYAARYLSNVQDPSPAFRAQVEEAARQSMNAKAPAAKVLEAWSHE